MHVDYYTTDRLMALWTLSGLPAWVSTRKVKARKVKPIWIYWSKTQWLAVTSA